MTEVLQAIVPIFVVVLTGYALTRGGMFTRGEMTTLSRFVVKVALPVLIFMNIYGRPAQDIFRPAYLLTYAVASALMIVLAHMYVRARKAPLARGAFLGMGMGGTNNGFMGMPILLILFPEWAGAAIGMSMIVDNTFIIPFTLLVAEQAVGEGSFKERTIKMIRGVLLHPMVIAIILALSLNTIGFEIPTMVERPLTLLANASTGAALFTVGGMLVGLKIQGAVLDIIFATAGKLLAMPAVAFALLWLLEIACLPALPIELKAAVVIVCALPTFSILPSLAESYGEADVSTAVMMLTTVLSFFTLTGWMLLLQGLGWL